MTVARQTPRPTGSAASPSDPGAVSEAREVALAGGVLAYLVRRSPRARRLRVTLDPRRGVIVTVPGSARRGWSRPEPAIEAFLAARERWIRRHLDRYAHELAELAARGGVTDGASIRFRGDLHRLRILADPQAGAARTTVTRVGGPEGDELIVRLGTGERRPIETILRDALVARARMAIQREIERHASALDVRPVGVGIRDPRTRWGSASRAGRLSFSWRLVLAPPEALETVVVHELAHLRVFGHGPRFWSVVASRRPDHATWRRWLRDHSVELHGALEA